ncbi:MULTISPECIES: hypothetical protein [Streptomyces]|uniref:hypothetical protein n=1 Tax=Streptomyces TaxID=1883 RepID=UPI00140B7F91|nr:MULTISPECIES: hypothetical protein [Streptomyces]MDH6225282.1 putative Zn finger protein [Streptomyces sp. MJP52]
MNDAAAPPAGSPRARTLPAFPARRGGPVRGRTAWGRTWTAAVEEVWPEGEGLRRGRAFARSGRLGPVTVAPGRVRAESFAGDAAHATELTARVLDDAAWDRICECAADRPELAAALLEGTPPGELAEAAEEAGVSLLPGHGDLDADCGCGAPEHPCAHAVGLAVQTAWLLDRDPWLLLVLRGRSREEVRDDLKSELLLRAMTEVAAEGDGPAAEDGEAAGAGPSGRGPGGEEHAGGGHAAGDDGCAGEEPFDEVPPEPDGRAPRANRAAYARERLPLPELPPLPGPRTGAEEPPATGIEADPLDRLVADAAVRARELLAYLHGAGSAEPPPPPDAWQDTVRLAATHPDPRARDRLRQAVADRAEERGLDLDAELLTEAWRTGGAAGLEVLEHPWTPGPRETARARTALAEAWSPDEEAVLTVEENRFTFGQRGPQLRLGRDGRWYGYRRQGGTWWPTGEPDTDPAAVTAGLLAADERNP